MKFHVAKMLFMAGVMSLVACGQDDDGGKTTQEKQDAASEGDATTDSEGDATTDNGICEEGERAIKVYCEGNYIVTRHADPACGEWQTTRDDTSCLKYQVVIAEAGNFTFNQKGVCSEASGKAECVLDTDYHCPDTATQKVKCANGYRISYWNFASCGDTEVVADGTCEDAGTDSSAEK